MTSARYISFFSIRNTWAFTGILLAGLILAGCNSPVESHKIDFEHECWKTQDTLRISFSNTGLSKKYSLQLDLTFTHDFKYRNLYVGLLSQSPSGKKQELKFPLELMDDGGNWFGKLSGKTISYHADLSRQDVFQQEGEYHFKLYQFMQDDLVCGVRNAAFSIWEEK